MRFGFRREKPKAKAEQVTAKEDVDAQTLREAINSAKVASTLTPSPTTVAVQHEKIGRASCRERV